jgi:ankyrin repeat protein
MNGKRYLPGDPRTQSENDFTETAASEEAGEEQVGLFGSLMRRIKGAPITSADKAKALRQAVRDQDIKKVELLLGSGVDLYEDQEASLPCIAARRQNLEMLDLLMRAGVDINQADRRGKAHKSRTPLMEAARRGWIEGIDALLVAKARQDIVDETGATALQLAVRSGRLAAVEHMLRRGADPNSARSLGPTLTCMHEAAFIEMTKLLVEAGAEVDAKDRQGLTPLHYQARAGRLSVIQYLLDLGADPNATDKSGRTPAFFIGQKGDGLGALNLLIAADADLSRVDKEENNCAHLMCARSDQESLFKRLAEAAPGLFAMTNHVGETPRSILTMRGFHTLAGQVGVTTEERRLRGEFIEPPTRSLFTGPAATSARPVSRSDHQK